MDFGGLGMTTSTPKAYIWVDTKTDQALPNTSAYPSKHLGFSLVTTASLVTIAARKCRSPDTGAQVDQQGVLPALQDLSC